MRLRKARFSIKEFWADLTHLRKGEPVSEEARVHWSIAQLYHLCANKLVGILSQRGSMTYGLESETALHEQVIIAIRRSMDDTLRRQGIALDVLYSMKQHAELMPMSVHSAPDLADADAFAEWILMPERAALRAARSQPSSAAERVLAGSSTRGTSAGSAGCDSAGIAPAVPLPSSLMTAVVANDPIAPEPPKEAVSGRGQESKRKRKNKRKSKSKNKSKRRK